MKKTLNRIKKIFMSFLLICLTLVGIGAASMGLFSIKPIGEYFSKLSERVLSAEFIVGKMVLARKLMNPELQGIVFDNHSLYMASESPVFKGAMREWGIANGFNCIIIGAVYREPSGRLIFTGGNGENPTDWETLVNYSKEKYGNKLVGFINNPSNEVLNITLYTFGRLSVEEKKSFILFGSTVYVLTWENCKGKVFPGFISHSSFEFDGYESKPIDIEEAVGTLKEKGKNFYEKYFG